MSDRKNHWESIYKHKSPLKVSWYSAEPALSLQLIHNCQIAFDAPLIDVGGGASLLVDRLLDEGFSDLAVLDVSGEALRFARNRLGARAGLVEWFETDITRFTPPRRFLLWHDRAVFHFLTGKADRNRYVHVLRQSLIPGGHLIIMAFAIDGPEKCSGLDVVQYDVNKLESELGSDFKLCESGHQVHITPAGKQQKFAYFRFVFKPVTT